jgi:hypothetical protein
MRFGANTGCRLHRVRPPGFSLSDKQLERAGMDYRADIGYVVHDDWNACLSTLAGRRLFALTTCGDGALRPRPVPNRRRFCFRPGDAWTSCGNPPTFRTGQPVAPAYASCQPQPESGQFRCSGGLRMVASASLRRRRVSHLGSAESQTGIAETSLRSGIRMNSAGSLLQLDLQKSFI